MYATRQMTLKSLITRLIMKTLRKCEMCPLIKKIPCTVALVSLLDFHSYKLFTGKTSLYWNEGKHTWSWKQAYMITKKWTSTFFIGFHRFDRLLCMSGKNTELDCCFSLWIIFLFVPEMSLTLNILSFTKRTLGKGRQLHENWNKQCNIASASSDLPLKDCSL